MTLVTYIIVDFDNFSSFVVVSNEEDFIIKNFCKMAWKLITKAKQSDSIADTNKQMDFEDLKIMQNLIENLHSRIKQIRSSRNSYTKLPRIDICS